MNTTQFPLSKDFLSVSGRAKLQQGSTVAFINVAFNQCENLTEATQRATTVLINTHQNYMEYNYTPFYDFVKWAKSLA